MGRRDWRLAGSHVGELACDSGGGVPCLSRVKKSVEGVIDEKGR